MGWASAGSIFDPVAKALIEAGASAELKRKTLGPLIDQLQANDWDTEYESLEEFRDDPVIVDLFRERDILANCGDTTGPDHADECTRHLGHDGDHTDDQNYSWPQTAGEDR